MSAPARRIVLIQGHPDADPRRYCRALEQAYCEGAIGAGHELRALRVSDFDLPYLRNQAQWRAPSASAAIAEAQALIAAADHLVFIYPLWLGDMPAMLKSFLEQASCGGSIMAIGEDGAWVKKLKGKSARIVVTMGMPAIAYRLFYLSHSLKSLERNILKFAGASPVRSAIVGSVETSPQRREDWLRRMRAFGAAAI